MKDKRLDILLEHFKQKKKCVHLIYDQGQTFCIKMMKDKFPTKVDCSGSIKACELEEWMKKGGTIISSKGAITPFAKMLEKEGIPVQETIFIGSPGDFLNAISWPEEQEKELQDLLNETRRWEIFKDVED